MTTNNYIHKVISAEKEVTKVLAEHGEDSEQYKKALKNFANNWLILTRRAKQVNSILED